MERPIPIRSRLLLAIAVLSTVGAATAEADDQRTGGASAPTRPVIDRLICGDGHTQCAPGQTLTLQGRGLGDARVVTFIGGRGERDDRRARPRVREAHLLTVRVPSRARTGVVRVTSATAGTVRSSARIIILRGAAASAGAAASDVLYAGGRSMVFAYRALASAAGQAVVEVVRVTDGAVVASWPVQPEADGAGQIAWDGTVAGIAVPIGRYAFRVSGAAQAAVTPDGGSPMAFDVFDAIFPIRGRHDLGRSATNGFGGGRGHMGQDLFASCGTQLVAARGGTVTFAGYEARAGNYLVITGPDQQSYAYMHMRKPSLLTTGQPVLTAQPVGEVGETGRANGCHLHFELWSTPGWRIGEGRAIDPLPELARWDAFS